MDEKKESVEDIKKELEECQKLRDEYLASWQRSRADFLNYKKEENIRMEGLINLRDGIVAFKIFPILDNLEVAEKKLPENLNNDENVKGVLQIKKQILDLLKSFKIEEIKVLGKKFDPNFHEVIEEVEPASAEASAGKSGIIIEEVQKGYTIEGRLLRPAKVKVTK